MVMGKTTHLCMGRVSRVESRESGYRPQPWRAKERRMGYVGARPGLKPWAKKPKPTKGAETDGDLGPSSVIRSVIRSSVENLVPIR